MQEPSPIVSILWRYKKAEPLSDEEAAVLEAWLRHSELNQELFDDLSNDSKWDADMAALQSKDEDAGWQRIVDRIEGMQEIPAKRTISGLKYAAAAAALILFSAATYFYWQKRPVPDGVQEVFKNDIAPGANHAILEMEDGRRFALDTLNNGQIARQGNTAIVKADSGLLTYTVKQQVSRFPEKSEYNILSTPNGGQYSLILPDRSRVWLNAGSSLRFPTSFTGNTRMVMLTGEAYFEVEKNKEKPFIVKTEGSMVRVLGTHFNMNAYKDESFVKTTLMEGSVRVSNGADSVLLSPGQQARADSNAAIKVAPANLQEALAWHNNIFWFQDSDFPHIMKQLSRWFNMEVVFTDPVKERFTGILPRNVALSDLLHILEKGGHVQFSIDGNKVTVGIKAGSQAAR